MKSTGFTIKVKKSDQEQLAGNFLIGCILYLGIILTCFSMLGVPPAIWWSCGTGIVFLLLLQFLDRFKKQIWIAALGVFLVCLILTAVKVGYLSDGFIITVDRVIEQAARHFGVVWELYGTTADSSVHLLCEALFLGVASLIVGMLAKAITYSKNYYLLFIITLPIIILQMVFGWSAHSVTVLLLLFGIFMTINHTFISAARKEEAGGKGRSAAGLQIAVLIAVFYLIAWGVFSLVCPGQSYQKNKAVQSVAQGMKEITDDVRHEKDKTNSLPQGQFTGLGDLTFYEKTALKVVMDEPASLYLRGFVGSVYTSTGFEALDYDTYYDSRDLYYWLDEGGFNGLTQLYTVFALEQGEDQVTEVDLSIQNVNANSKYIYNTYGMITNPQSIANSKNQGDETLLSTGFFGNRYYRYKAASGLIPLYPQLAFDFYQMKDDEALESYTLLESNFNEDVYQKYTEVPEDVKELLKNHLEVEPREGQDHYQYEEANTIIMQYLNENITYSEEVSEYDGSRDFIEYFLEWGSEGYSVHYAATATMMYRYLGIPARYVEGYLIMPSDVEDAEAYQEIEITGDHAHAWVEIYQDGIGWIPMEVTPPYLDIMDRPQFELAASASGNGDASGSGGSAGDDEEVQTDDDPLRKKTKGEEERSRLIKKTAVYLGAGLLIGFVLVLLIYIIWGRRKLKQRLARLETESCAEAVCHMYQYLMIWLHYNGLTDEGGSRYRYTRALSQQYSDDIGSGYERVVAIVQEAAYSRHTITQDHREEVRKFMVLTKENVLNSKNPIQKIWMRLWDFIY